MMKQKHAYFLLVVALLLSGFCSFIPFVKAATSITYNAGTNIITVDDATGFGDSWVNAFDFWDIWNTSNVNGWGAVRMYQTNNVTYEFGCRIIFQTGVYFWDRQVQVTFNSSSVSGNGQILMDIRNAHVRFGNLDDATEKLTSQGVHFLAVDSGHNNVRLLSAENAYLHGEDVQVYSCSFKSTSPVGVRSHQIVEIENDAPFYNCLFDGTSFNSEGDLFRITISRTTIGLGYRTSGTFEDVYLERPNTNYIYCWTNVQKNITNVKGRELIGANAFYMVSTTVNSEIINGDLDLWTFSWSGVNTGALFRKYEFDLMVTYPNGTAINGTSTGARVTIQHYGNNSAVDYNATLNVDGTINQTVLTMGFYNQTGDDTIYNYNPHSLTVSNVTGFQTYTKNFTLSEKTDWTISLTQSVGSSAILIVVGIILIPTIILLGMFLKWK